MVSFSSIIMFLPSLFAFRSHTHKERQFWVGGDSHCPRLASIHQRRFLTKHPGHSKGWLITVLAFLNWARNSGIAFRSHSVPEPGQRACQVFELYIPFAALTSTYVYTRIVYNTPIPHPLPAAHQYTAIKPTATICLFEYLLNRRARIEVLWIENKKQQNLLKVFSSCNDLVLDLHAKIKKKKKKTKKKTVS